MIKGRETGLRITSKGRVTIPAAIRKQAGRLPRYATITVSAHTSLTAAEVDAASRCCHPVEMFDGPLGPPTVKKIAIQPAALSSPSITSAEVSATLPFVIPSEAEGPAVLLP